MLAFAQTYDMERYGAEGGPLHDPNVIAWLIRPDLYGGRDVNVEVETGSELTMGQTVIDWWGATTRPKNAHVVREVDDAALLRAARRADRQPVVVAQLRLRRARDGMRRALRLARPLLTPPSVDP